MQAFADPAVLGKPDVQKGGSIKIERMDKPKQGQANSLATQSATSVSTEESLFLQFGGDEKLLALVDTWLANTEHLEAARAHNAKYEDPVECEILKEKFFQYLKFLFGGSKHYIGRPLAEVHKDLGITDERFDEVNRKFVSSVQ